ncbi:MAG: lipocalin family protein [Oligoflexia bacterium]|nr:lipocalin family protein [Oligoflexia bacterium]
MVKNLLFFSLLIYSCSYADVESNDFDKYSLPTVASVNIEKYMGTWYEIAKYPNWFEKGCGATQANYKLLNNGYVSVINRCRELTNVKKIKEAIGTAYVADQATNAKLKVSFVPFFQRWGFFAGDYWILALDPEYQYALVGTPDRKYLWILSRSPTLDEAIIKQLKEIAEKDGFDLSKLVVTEVWTD